MRTTEISCMQTSASSPSSHERLSSSVTALVMEEILGKLGVHATLSDLVRGAQLLESAISHRLRATSWSIDCAE